MPMFNALLTSRKKLDAINSEPLINFMNIPSVKVDESFGADINIISIVREHAPKRVLRINKEIDQLNSKLVALSLEKLQLEGLIKALV